MAELDLEENVSEMYRIYWEICFVNLPTLNFMSPLDCESNDVVNTFLSNYK